MTTLNSAETLLTQLMNNTMPADLIGIDSLAEPGSALHDAAYEQLSRFSDAIKAAKKNGHMTERQALMFECRFIRSMRQLLLAQNNPEARGFDAHIRAGQGTILCVREDGKWFTKLNRSNNILCVGAYLAAVAKRANCWTFLVFTEDGDVHAD